MPNEQLLTYIRQNYGTYTRQQITEALLSSGWALGDIAASYEAVEREKNGTALQTPQVMQQTPDSNFLAEMQKRRGEMAQQPSSPMQSSVNAEVRAFASSLQQQRSSTTEKGIVGMLMKTGLVKTPAQANVAMILIVVVCLGLSVWFVWPSSAPSAPAMTTPLLKTPSTSAHP